MTFLLIAVAGALGALFRYLVDFTLIRLFGSIVPLGTLSVNVSGSLFLGLLLGGDQAFGPAATLLIATGFLASYTTFSTWMYETIRLVEEKQWSAAAAALLLNLLLGIAAVSGGYWIAGG
jgi:fluoride exporter